MLDDPYFFFAFGDFQFRNTGFLNEVDEFLEFTQIHGDSLLCSARRAHMPGLSRTIRY